MVLLMGAVIGLHWENYRENVQQKAVWERRKVKQSKMRIVVSLHIQRMAILSHSLRGSYLVI